MQVRFNATGEVRSISVEEFRSALADGTDVVEVPIEEQMRGGTGEANAGEIMSNDKGRQPFLQVDEPRKEDGEADRTLSARNVPGATENDSTRVIDTTRGAATEDAGTGGAGEAPESGGGTAEVRTGEAGTESGLDAGATDQGEHHWEAPLTGAATESHADQSTAAEGSKAAEGEQPQGEQPQGEHSAG